MMTITVNNALAALEAFKKLGENSFPAAVAYEIVTLLIALDKALTNFYKQREELINKYGEDETDESGQRRIKKEFVETFNEELNALLLTSLSFECEQIDVSSLGDFEITPMDILPIYNFFKK